MADPTGNEPAAPVVKTTETVQRVTAKYRGLSKREYFAGLAMAGLLSRDEARPPNASKEAHDQFAALGARYAVAHADALLAELARGGAA